MKENYIAPMVEIIEVAVEKGYAGSNLPFVDEFGDPV